MFISEGSQVLFLCPLSQVSFFTKRPYHLFHLGPIYKTGVLSKTGFSIRNIETYFQRAF